jgi:hypothetical protein
MLCGVQDREESEEIKKALVDARNETDNITQKYLVNLWLAFFG